MITVTNEASSRAPTRKEPPHVVTFIPETRLLVTLSRSKSLSVWDLDARKQAGELLLDDDAKVWTVTASSYGCCVWKRKLKWIACANRLYPYTCMVNLTH